MSYGRVNLVITGGKTKFETHEEEPPKKDKWTTKKRLKMQRKREKEKRRAANRKDPRRLGVKGKKKKQRFASAEERVQWQHWTSGGGAGDTYNDNIKKKALEEAHFRMQRAPRFLSETSKEGTS